ncbi:hypothetical protein WJX74_000967 [Apatococcus lobatus]|uniref:J domain-containing protein n=1 Tax=Apatococcus lobatus TaxID=904363 RepID=A0AAW1RZ41_9CHLO
MAGPDKNLRDPYEVLGISRSATEDEVKSSYRKLALRLHPDKNRGLDPEVAADRFKEVATAYSILGDADKRRRYDAGGFNNLQQSDLDFEVDLSQLGMVNTAFAAIFSKLGVPIKTRVAPQVLDVAYAGDVEPEALTFNQTVSGWVGGQSRPSRFKLLLFERSSEGRWEPACQEDSQEAQRISTAGIYVLPFDTHRLGPKPSMLQMSQISRSGHDPFEMAFRRLDTLQPRDHVRLQPGQVLVAVVGDNWFKRVNFELQALSLPAGSSSHGHAPGSPAMAADPSHRWFNSPPSATSSPGVQTESSHPQSPSGDGQPSLRGRPLHNPAAAIRWTEEQLRDKQRSLRGFETEFRQVQKQFTTLCEKHKAEQEGMEELLSAREDAYLDLLQIPAVAAPRHTPAASSLPSNDNVATHGNVHSPAGSASIGQSGGIDDESQRPGTEARRARPTGLFGLGNFF